MSPVISTRILGLSFVLLGAASSAFAGAPTKCDKIAQDVRESVAKEPSKVLMIVEDALVINESCACEIIKAAITSAKADKPMVKQIVQTAVAVAPKMTPIIVECANAVSPGAVSVNDAPETASKHSGKDAKSVQPAESDSILPPKEKGSDFSVSGASSIRGVYLMAPSVGGFLTTGDSTTDTSTPPSHKGNKPKTPQRKIIVEPLSPSMAGWTP